MKKVIAVFLAFLVLASNLGFAMNTHLCCGVAVKHSLSIGLSDLDCGMADTDRKCASDPTDECRLKPKPCCQNLHQVLQLDENVDIQSPVVEVKAPFFIALIQVFTQPSAFFQIQVHTFSDYPPPLPDKDIQVLYQTFLI